MERILVAGFRRNFPTVVAKAALCGVALLAMSSIARADVTTTITNAPLTNGDTVSGSFTVDVYGYLSNSPGTDLVLSDPSNTPIATFGPGAVAPEINAPTDTTVIAFDGSYNDYLYLVFNAPLNAVGPSELIYSASYWCDGSWACDAAGDGDAQQIFFGSLTTDSVVPEPLTLSLFGAGIFGAAMTRRRRSSHEKRTA